MGGSCSLKGGRLGHEFEKKEGVQGCHDPSSTIKITKTRQHSSSMHTSHLETVNV